MKLGSVWKVTCHMGGNFPMKMFSCLARKAKDWIALVCCPKRMSFVFQWLPIRLTVSIWLNNSKIFLLDSSAWLWWFWIMLECIPVKRFRNADYIGRQEVYTCFTCQRPCPKVLVYGQEAYSPELNIIEILWRELKCRWLKSEDYACLGELFYQVTLALAAVGTLLRVNFSEFGLS